MRDNEKKIMSAAIKNAEEMVRAFRAFEECYFFHLSVYKKAGFFARHFKYREVKKGLAEVKRLVGYADQFQNCINKAAKTNNVSDLLQEIVRHQVTVIWAKKVTESKFCIDPVDKEVKKWIGKENAEMMKLNLFSATNNYTGMT